MAAVAEPIVRPADLAAYLASDPQALIDAATAAVRRYCGWHIAPSRSETLTFRSDGSLTQILPTLRVTSIESVTYDGLLLDPTSYQWDPWGVLSYAPSTLWPSYWGSYRAPAPLVVTLTHGFDSVPDVAAVITSIVARAQASPDGITRSQVGQVSQTYSQTGQGQAGGLAFLPNELSVLDLYRLASRP